MLRRTAAALCCALGAAAGAPPAAVSHASIMYQGDSSAEGVKYNAFMVPGLVSTRGHLLAFAEGRTHTCDDFGHHDMVMRASADDGASWAPLRTILDPDTIPGCNRTEACLPYTGGCQTGKGRVCGGGCAVWDPTPVADERTGAVHLFFSRSTTSCLGGARPGLFGGVPHDDLWVMTTTDLGATWMAPRNVTAQCSTPYGGGVTMAGGHGVQLTTGELVVPLYNVPAARGGQGLCRSRDHGETWAHGGAAGPVPGQFDGPFEGEIVELFGKTPAGGPRLMYDTRVQAHEGSGLCGAGVRNCRVTYTSDDLGDTWHNVTAHPEMHDPSCKGGIVRYEGSDGRAALFAVGPDSDTVRVNDTLWASVDDGARFDRKLRIDTSGGYSTVQITRSGRVAVFYNHAPRGRGGDSTTGPGGCSFNLALVDPAALLSGA